MPKTRIKLDQIEGGKTLRKLIEWYKKENKNSFMWRFKNLRERTLKSAEKAGYRSQDIERLIAEIRTESGKK